MFEKYILIEAAGGIVQCNDLFLVIKRKGFWDIPKGMVDNGESVESACISEITEECGIRWHQIIEPLTQTYHTMKWNGQDALKKNHLVYVILHGIIANIYGTIRRNY